MGGLFHRWRHPRRSYLICAIARSGSNLLSDALRDTGRAGRPNQFFLPSAEARFARAYHLPPAIGFADYLREISRRSATSNEVFGFKLMAWYLPAFLHRLRATGAFAQPNESDLTMLRAAFPRLRLISITRRNKIRQAVSKARATQTGLWKVQDGREEIREPEFDRALIAKSLRETVAEEEAWEQFYDRLGEEPYRLEYEALCGDHVSAVSSVLEFLEINVPRKRIHPPVTVRQADEISRDWEERFRAEA